MRYGVCTWVFGTQDLDRIAAAVGLLGYDGVELLGDIARYQPSDVRRITARHGLDVLSVTPANADPAHPDRVIRDHAIDDYRRMLDFAAGVEARILGFHGVVGRVRPIASQREEEKLLLDSARRIAEYAETLGIRLAVEVLNRYETHLLNTCEQAVRFVVEVESPVVGILLDAYHMNIEEANPLAAIDAAGDRLILFHVADSNRRGIGRGHIPFRAIFDRLSAAGYNGSVIVEVVVPDSDPFAAGVDEIEVRQTFDEARASITWLHGLDEGRSARKAANDCSGSD